VGREVCGKRRLKTKRSLETRSVLEGADGCGADGTRYGIRGGSDEEYGSRGVLEEESESRGGLDGAWWKRRIGPGVSRRDGRCAWNYAWEEAHECRGASEEEYRSRAESEEEYRSRAE